MSIDDIPDDALDVGQSELIDELDIIELLVEEEVEEVAELSIEDIELSIIELDMQSSIIEELDIIEESIAEEELL